MKENRQTLGYDSDEGLDEYWDAYLKKNPPSWMPKGE
jgi:hypothetical protein